MTSISEVAHDPSLPAPRTTTTPEPTNEPVSVPVLRRWVTTLPEPLRLMAGYHLGWWDTRGQEMALPRGKMIRSALCAAASTACGATPHDAGASAAAVELLHNFTLIHDDVMDRDDLRRGRTTVWRVWGVNEAVLLGDALHGLAFRVLAASAMTSALEATDRLAATTTELCQGQSEDCRFETRTHVDLDEYTAMVMGKTGSLMGCASALGALAAGADSATVAAMDTFGRELGMAFQVADDLLGIWGEPAVTGKPVGNDLARRKWTLPVVAAIGSGAAAGFELAELYGTRHRLSEDEVARATTLVELAGGREFAADYAESRAAAAFAALPSGLSTDALQTLAREVPRRDM